MQNLNKPADRVLTDLINETNAIYGNFVPFQYDVLTFQNVTALTGQDRNTSIEVTDIEEPSETDWLTLNYNRVSLTTATHYKAPILAHDGDWESVHDALDAINERFGLQLTTDDVEDDDMPSFETYPANLLIRAKSGSLIYIGSTTLQLVDPEAGDQILTEPDTSFNTTMHGGFDSGSRFNTLGLSNTKFVVSENSEIEVGLAVALLESNGNVQSSVTPVEDLYSFLVAGDSRYGLAFNVFLKNSVNAEALHDLYNLRLVIESTSGSTQFFDMNLYYEGGAYHLRSQDHLIDLTVANNGIYVGTKNDGEFLQGVINFADYPGVFAGYSKNDVNSPYGTWHAFIVATRKSGEAAEVGHRITVQTEVVADVRGYLLPQQATTFQLVEDAEDDYTFNFTYRVHVIGLSGVTLSPIPQINVTFERSGSEKVSFVPTTLSQSGVTLNTIEGTGAIPAALGVGMYEINGQMVVDASWDLTDDGLSIPMSISFMGTRGEQVTSAINWQAQSAPVLNDLPQLIADDEPSYPLLIEESWTFNVTLGNYVGTEPMTIQRRLQFLDSGNTVLREVVIPNDWNHFYLSPSPNDEWTFQVNQHERIRLWERASNQFGNSVVTLTDILGEFLVEEPSEGDVTQDSAPTLIDTSNGAGPYDQEPVELIYTPGTYTGGEISNVRVDIGISLNGWFRDKFVDFKPDNFPSSIYVTTDENSEDIENYVFYVPAGHYVRIIETVDDSDYYTDEVGPIGEGEGSFVMPTAEIVWDPSYKQHRISSDFINSIDEDGGSPVFQWKVGNTVLYRDAYIGEGIVSREQFIPAPTIAGITTNGTALTANITVMKGNEIYTGVTAPYTMTSAESDLTAGVTHAAITGVTINNFQITAMTITPAVFPAFDEEAYEIRTFLYGFRDSVDNNPMQYSGPLSSMDVNLPGSGYFSLIVEQMVVPIGASSNYRYALHLSRSAEFRIDCNPGANYATSNAGRDDTLVACVGRPEILRAVRTEDERPAIIWPGQWYLPRHAMLSLYNASYLSRIEGFPAQSPTDLISTSTAQIADYNTYGGDAGDDIIAFVQAYSSHDTLPVNYDDPYSYFVSSTVSTLLTQGQGASQQLPTLTAPIIDNVLGGNTFTVHPAAPLAGNVRRVWLQWALRYNAIEEYGPWLPVGWSWQDSITTFTNRRDFYGVVDLGSPENLSNGAQIEVCVAMIVEYTDNHVEFSGWSDVFVLNQSYWFESYRYDLGASYGARLASTDWTAASNETNLIQEALDENGYAIITAAYYNGVQVFDGTTEYRMVPANINAAMRLYNANPMMQGGSPVMTPSDSYLADITFYNSDDEELGSAVGRIEFKIEPQ